MAENTFEITDDTFEGMVITSDTPCSCRLLGGVVWSVQNDCPYSG